MVPPRRVGTMSAAVIVAVFSIGISPMLQASEQSLEIEEKMTALKSCVAKHHEKESKKKTPKGKNLLTVCAKEASELFAALPPSVVDDVRHQIESDIDETLRKKSSN